MNDENIEPMTIKDLFVGFVKEHPIMFTMFCVLILAYPINEVILPHYYGKIINAIQSKASITPFLVPVIALFSIAQAFNVASDYIDVKIQPLIIAYVREYCLSFLHKLSSNYLQDYPIGAIMARLIRVPFTFFAYMNDLVAKYIPTLVTFIGIVIYILFTDWMLALIVFAIMIVVLGFSFLTVDGCIETAQTRDFHYNKIYEEVDDVLRNQVSVLSSNTYDFERSKRDQIQERYSKYAEKTLECSIRYKFFAIMIVIGLLCGFVLRCVRLFKNKRLPYAIIISIFMIMFSMFNKVLSHTDAYKDMVYRYGILLDSLGLFNNLIPSSRKPKAYETFQTIGNQPPSEICISVQNVSFTHPDAVRPILKNVSVDFKCNESVALIGNLGSGKSTLLKLILRYVKPVDGIIYLYGRPYDKLDPETIRKHIGYIHQVPILFNRSIFENITYGQTDANEEVVWKLLDSMGVRDVFDKFPDKLQTNVGKNGSKLSGGERQLVIIARVLMQDPDIIVFDEPTSSLDPKATKKVIDIMLKIKNIKTLIVITHDHSLLKHFDRVVTIENGQIVQANA